MHPEPPKDLASRQLPLIETTNPWFRMHKTLHNPLYFGFSPQGRFNAPIEEYGVMYVAESAECAFIETLGSMTGIRLISENELSIRSLSIIKCQRPLKLVDLTGAGLARIGADAELCTGEHTLAQRWSLALWQHPDQIDGIYYRARHDPSQCCTAIFDRVKPICEIDVAQELTDRSFQIKLANILNSYNFGLIP